MHDYTGLKLFEYKTEIEILTAAILPIGSNDMVNEVDNSKIDHEPVITTCVIVGM